MAWLHNIPMNDFSLGPFNHHGIEFYCETADLRTPVYFCDENAYRQLFAREKAFTLFISHHATMIHKELNGFRGYDCIEYKNVSSEELQKIIEVGKKNAEERKQAAFAAIQK